jgi:PhnB protein
MLADEHPEMDVRGPHAYGGTAVSFLLYVEDVDRVFADALRAGARQLRAVENKFYGDRAGMLEDPFGHQWMIATHVEDVTPEEMRRRAAQQSQA